ncbi:MAG: hypothetical protein ACOCQL_01900 [Halolamina sp.]
MAYALWQYVVAGAFLLVAGGIQAVSPGMEPVQDRENYARVSRGIGAIVMAVGIGVLALGAWRAL